MPLPELITTGNEQPLIRASEPAAAIALARTGKQSPYKANKLSPTLAPKLFFIPSLAIAILQFICLDNISFTSSKFTVSANSIIFFTFNKFLSASILSA